MKRLEPARWKDTAKTRPDVADLSATGRSRRSRTSTSRCSSSTMAHAKSSSATSAGRTRSGDGFVYLPKEQVLCTGDAVVNGPYNATMDANIGNWPTVLRSAGKLKVKHVLPGHGLPGGRRLIDGQAQFMTELHKAVKAGVDQGKKLEDLQASIQLPESVIDLGQQQLEGPDQGRLRGVREEVGRAAWELTRSRITSSRGLSL